jgi:DNA-binding NtrC family response regulator
MGYLKEHAVSVIVLDLYMPNLSGLDLLPELASEYPDIPVIVMTALVETETAVNCMKRGAFDFLVKPVEPERLIATIRRAVEHRAMCNELTSLRDSFFLKKYRTRKPSLP